MSPSNGGAGGTARLLKLRDDLREKLTAVEATLRLLGLDAQETAERRASTTLAGALRHEAERRQHTWGGPRRRVAPEAREARHAIIRDVLRQHPPAGSRDIAQALARSGDALSISRVARILDAMGREVERVGTGATTRYRLRDTAKARTAPRTGSSASGYHSTAAERARRTRTATLLEKFADSPRPRPAGAKPAVLAALVRTGYLRKDGDGYVRTGKVFQVEK